MTEFIFYLFCPSSSKQTAIFYTFWIFTYTIINLVWDITSKKTEVFQFGHLDRKINVLYNAASFASSLLVVISVFSEPVRKIAGDIMVPLLLAGISGVVISVSELCPYKHRKVFS